MNTPTDDEPANPRFSAADIARLAYVSEATVSRVLNHRPGVAPDTRRRVQHIMNQHGFLEHRSRPHRVAILVPNVSNPALADLVQALERELTTTGVLTVIRLGGDSGAHDADIITDLSEQGINGLVFASCSNAQEGTDPTITTPLTKRHIPFVCINGVFTGSRAPNYATDHRAGAAMAIHHLAGLGHRDIALVAGPTDSTPGRQRLRGWRDALAEFGLPAPPRLLLHEPYTIAGGVHAAKTLLTRDVSAIVTANDLQAVGVLHTAQHHGLHVPHDLSVVGFDDSVLVSSSGIPLTTVRQPLTALARVATRGMLDLLEGREPIRPQPLTPELIIRATTAGRSR